MALTRKEAKLAETAAYRERVRLGLKEAHLAAVVAFDEFMKSAPLTPEGLVADLCGTASVIVYRPKYRLRAALKDLGEIERADGGAWYVSNFTKMVNQQSVAAQRAACEAARSVLVRHLPGEGEFFAKSRID